MIQLEYFPHFLKKLKKIIKHNVIVKEKINIVLELLQENRFSPLLRSHKVVSHYDGKIAYASFVSADIRILWREKGGAQSKIEILECIDIGGHSGGKKVYK